uniref:Uncharacterized protein n=1 Tax=Haptolina brevifila TaxID=156173 RepID=A0A7S2HMK8_9EUKA|mmetsp:Transcript_56052/g.111276  ORF Transcript_56052/g.111276 Transcript_56052/m.111276 type:complete len:141 (+) Transcript_56052:215-637(+)
MGIVEHVPRAQTDTHRSQTPRADAVQGADRPAAAPGSRSPSSMPASSAQMTVHGSPAPGTIPPLDCPPALDPAAPEVWVRLKPLDEGIALGRECWRQMGEGAHLGTDRKGAGAGPNWPHQQHLSPMAMSTTTSTTRDHSR